MTEAEKKMKQYVNAVERKLNLPREVKARVMSDFSSSINARREAGLTDEEVYAELGTPKEAAAELNEQMKEFAYRKSPWRFLFLAAAVFSGLWLAADAAFQMAILSSLEANLGQAGSVGIIGGADGPTAVFLTAKVGFDWNLLLMVLLLAAGIFGFLRLRKCKKK